MEHVRPARVALLTSSDRTVLRSRDLRSKMSIDNARFLIGLGRFDLDAVERGQLRCVSLRRSPDDVHSVK
jgi:hypothetical protein